MDPIARAGGARRGSKVPRRGSKKARRDEDVEMVTGAPASAITDDDWTFHWDVHEGMKPLRLDRLEILQVSCLI